MEIAQKGLTRQVRHGFNRTQIEERDRERVNQELKNATDGVKGKLKENCRKDSVKGWHGGKLSYLHRGKAGRADPEVTDALRRAGMGQAWGRAGRKSTEVYAVCGW